MTIQDLARIAATSGLTVNIEGDADSLSRPITWVTGLDMDKSRELPVGDGRSVWYVYSIRHPEGGYPSAENPEIADRQEFVI